MSVIATAVAADEDAAIAPTTEMGIGTGIGRHIAAHITTATGIATVTATGTGITTDAGMTTGAVGVVTWAATGTTGLTTATGTGIEADTEIIAIAGLRVLVAVTALLAGASMTEMRGTGALAGPEMVTRTAITIVGEGTSRI